MCHYALGAKTELKVGVKSCGIAVEIWAHVESMA
jgi:hypothetical protein